MKFKKKTILNPNTFSKIKMVQEDFTTRANEQLYNSELKKFFSIIAFVEFWVKDNA